MPNDDAMSSLHDTLVLKDVDGDPSLWPAGVELPAGWSCLYGADTAESCRAYLKKYLVATADRNRAALTSTGHDLRLPGAARGEFSMVDEDLLPTETPGDRSVRAAHRLYEQLIGLWAPAVIECAHELGIFPLLSGPPVTSAEVSSTLGTDPRTTRVLLDALHAYGIVHRTRAAGTSYAVTEETRDLVVPGGLFSLVGKFVHDLNVAWPAWRNLAATVRGDVGTPAVQPNQISDVDYESLVGGINFWAPPIVSVLLQELRSLGMTERQTSVLDVGCGTGLYSQLMLQECPRWHATGLDRDRIAPLAVAQAERLGVADRFGMAVRDLREGNWGDGYDLVFFANIFHLQTPESACELARHAAASLSEAGVVAVVDQTYDGTTELTAPQDRFALLFSASMANTGGGDAYTFQDYESWFSQAGLRRFAVLDTPMHRILLFR